ncbi:Rrf2 family transcriptional regulator [Saccharomonospora sp. NPDC046836]|uniref:RrF2 family transcriptional regulator n=1 Tax=Saccharomonospora sp. NPDC046836 TaxID=3156921 RepID=UPI0033E84EE3
MLDIRFSSALKALLLLAVAAEDGSPILSSAQLAEGLNTNPSLVRKLLVPLVRAGLVESAKGRAGGARLARPAQDITLAEIYRCSVGDKPLWACRPEGEHVCLVTAHTGEYFARLTEQAEQAVLGALGDQTLADSLRELRSIQRESGSRC